MRVIAMSTLLSLNIIAAGCKADIDIPKLKNVAVVVDDEVLVTQKASYLSDTTIDEDVPFVAELRLEFDEPMAIASAEERIQLKDAYDVGIPILFSQKRQMITIIPEEPLEEQNYALEIERGIEDSSGAETIQSYHINFYAADGGFDTGA
jgi:hypothetical protein